MNITKDKLAKFRQEILDHSLYRPDLSPWNFHICGEMKKQEASKRQEISTGHSIAGGCLRVGSIPAQGILWTGHPSSHFTIEEVTCQPWGLLSIMWISVSEICINYVSFDCPSYLPIHFLHCLLSVFIFFYDELGFFLSFFGCFFFFVNFFCYGTFCATFKNILGVRFQFLMIFRSLTEPVSCWVRLIQWWQIFLMCYLSMWGGRCCWLTSNSISWMRQLLSPQVFKIWLKKPKPVWLQYV